VQRNQRKGEIVMSRIGDSSSASETGKGQGGKVTEAASNVGQNLRDLGGQVRDVATQKYEQLRESASDYYQQGRERAQEWEQNIEDYVREKPLQSVLIAAGVGVLLGLLWKRI
jgi:ElaB/YqjD/DUF883 family membrane-anchored ribosome-binding protein